MAVLVTLMLKQLLQQFTLLTGVHSSAVDAVFACAQFSYAFSRFHYINTLVMLMVIGHNEDDSCSVLRPCICDCCSVKEIRFSRLLGACKGICLSRR
jgi:hypothetical protein